MFLHFNQSIVSQLFAINCNANSNLNLGVGQGNVQSVLPVMIVTKICRSTCMLHLDKSQLTLTLSLLLKIV